MRILQPQTESGPRNYFFIFFSFCFSFFFLFHIILRSCEIVIFIFFIPQLCGNVILICLSCFPHVQLILSCSYLFLFLHLAIMYLSFSIEHESKQNQKRKILYTHITHTHIYVSNKK